MAASPAHPRRFGTTGKESTVTTVVWLSKERLVMKVTFWVESSGGREHENCRPFDRFVVCDDFTRSGARSFRFRHQVENCGPGGCVEPGLQVRRCQGTGHASRQCHC